MLLVWYSGMRQTDRKPRFLKVFRSDNNSPFAEHLTPVHLLCICQIYYSTLLFYFNRLFFHDLLFCTKVFDRKKGSNLFSHEFYHHSVQLYLPNFTEISIHLRIYTNPFHFKIFLAMIFMCISKQNILWYTILCWKKSLKTKKQEGFVNGKIESLFYLDEGTSWQQSA